LRILVLVTATVGPLLVSEFVSALNYKGPPVVDGPSMVAGYSVIMAIPLVIAWIVVAGTRLRRALVRRRYIRWR
jgi:hypothetical protein